MGLWIFDAILKQWDEDSESYAEVRLRQYQEGKQYVEDFRNSLASMAATLSKSHDGRPIIVSIDELDRCIPSYAIELLEIAKHLFSAGPRCICAGSESERASTLNQGCVWP